MYRDAAREQEVKSLSDLAAQFFEDPVFKDVVTPVLSEELTNAHSHRVAYVDAAMVGRPETAATVKLNVVTAGDQIALEALGFGAGKAGILNHEAYP
jgi:hypothetical protein